MGFAEGFAAGSSGLRGALALGYEERARQRQLALQEAAAAREAERFGWEQQDRRGVRDAMGNLESLQGGVVDAPATGLRQPSAQMLHTQGYGGATGEQAVRDAAGDFSREEARMGLQRTHDATAPISTRQASDQEINRAAQRVALAQKDMAGWRNIEADTRATKVKDARKAEFQRVSKLKDNEVADLFQESVNANPDVPAMVDFDPKTRKYVIVSKIPGIPTQQLSRAEMLQAVMGAWEAGNGDYAAGVQAMVAGAQNQRGVQDKNFERSRGLATDNAALHFKGLTADQDAARTRATAASSGATAGYYGVLTKERQDQAAAHKEALKLGEQFEQLSPEEQAGPKGQGLIRRFNILNSKPGSMVPLGGQGRAVPEFAKVPEDGTRVRDARGNVLTYQEGEPLLRGGVPASQRPALMARLELPPQADRLMQWEPSGGGRFVSVPDDSDTIYDLGDKNDLMLLKAALERTTMAATSAMERVRRDPKTGNIYDSGTRGHRGISGSAELAAERDRDRQRQRAYGITTR